MLGSQAIETAIGLAVMFFILATAASATTETISRFMKKRSADLERTIKDMLSSWISDDVERSLTKRKKRAEKAQEVRGEADNFMRMFKGTSIWQAAEAAAGRSLIQRKKMRNSYLSAKSFADAVHEVLTSQPAETLAEALPVSLGNRLAALQKEAKRGMLDVKAGLETWFDETMNRAEGAYKRWASLVLFFAGLSLAVLGNASTTDMAQDLWQNSATRQAVAAAAGNITSDTANDIKDVGTATDELASFQLPVGWDVTKTDDDDTNDGLIAFLKHSTFWPGMFTVLGWVLTALLVMLGGPFWFDLLSRLVSLRGSGTKPPLAVQDDTSATSLGIASVTSLTNPANLAVAPLVSAEVIEAYRTELEPITKLLEARKAKDERIAAAAPAAPARPEEPTG